MDLNIGNYCDFIASFLIEISLTAFMELATYVISIIAVYPSNYKWLSLISIALVLSAAILFTIWY